MSREIEAGLAARLRGCVANAAVGMSEEESVLVAREALAYVRDVLLTRERIKNIAAREIPNGPMDSFEILQRAGFIADAIWALLEPSAEHSRGPGDE